jgi:hypothetical protein
MPGHLACCTLLYVTDPETLAARYEAGIEPADGYLTYLDGWWMLVDATATATGNWARQRDIGLALSDEAGVALSIFITGDEWALALAVNGEPGPTAIFTPQNDEVMARVPFSLMALEQALGLLYPDRVDVDEVDYLFGALLEGALAPEEAVDGVVRMLGVPDDWMRWSWYESIPEQLFTDPDLADRVVPLGDAKDLWEE